MMNLDSFNRIDVSDRKSGNVVECQVPKGNWKVMAFYLNDDFRPASVKGGSVDYLDRDAVAKYIAINFRAVLHAPQGILRNRDQADFL